MPCSGGSAYGHPLDFKLKAQVGGKQQNRGSGCKAEETGLHSLGLPMTTFSRNV